jgi:hypothetical protein
LKPTDHGDEFDGWEEEFEGDDSEAIDKKFVINLQLRQEGGLLNLYK